MADLRETLATALDAHETTQEAVAQTDVTQQVTETDAQREERQRDVAGRFKAKEEANQAAKPTSKPAIAAAPAVQQSEPRKPPSSWKKDYWEAYQKLDPNVADYISQREEQFANGVSTYKQEAERAKELFDAIAPFQQDLQQFGVQPAQWLRQLGAAHQTLVKGSPEQKLQAFHKLAQDYHVPLDALLDQNVRQQFLTSQPPPPPQDVGKLVEEKFMQVQATSEIEKFAADPSHEHFPVVKERMSQLLGAGLAQDLKSAYDMSVRMDPDLFEREQLRVNEAAEKQRREQAAVKVNTARANAVSPRSATPTGQMASNGKKDLRGTLEEAAEAVLGSARV